MSQSFARYLCLANTYLGGPASCRFSMSSESPRITVRPETVRRLAVTKQHLAGRSGARPDAAAILALIRDLGCIQLDPISVVAPSHLIVLWSRLGRFDRSEL